MNDSITDVTVASNLQHLERFALQRVYVNYIAIIGYG